MPVYEIVNPSDACTIEAPDDKHAVAAGITLGRGSYGIRECRTGRHVLSLGLFGIPAELVEHFGPGDASACIETMTEWQIDNAAAQAAVFESFVYGSASERAFYATAIADSKEPAKFKAAHRDRKRSSMNDIGKAADACAEFYRERAAKAERAGGAA